MFVPEVPDFFAISAAREGYIPDSVNVGRADLRGSTLEVDFGLLPESEAGR